VSAESSDPVALRALTCDMSDEDMATKRKSTTSGTPWTEEDYRNAGYGTIKARVPAEYERKLGELAKAWGCTRQDALASMIRRARADAPPKIVSTRLKKDG
jgi:hypothetical protein